MLRYVIYRQPLNKSKIPYKFRLTKNVETKIFGYEICEIICIENLITKHKFHTQYKVQQLENNLNKVSGNPPNMTQRSVKYDFFISLFR